MAENTIDTLELQISSTADAAVRSINNMSRALQGVNNTLTGLNSHGLRSYAKGIGQVTAAIQSLNSVNTGNISKAVTQLKALSNIDFSKFENKKLKIDVEISGGDAAKKMQYAIEKSLDQTKIDTSKISAQLINAFDLKGGAASRLRKQMETLAEQLTASFDGKSSFDSGEWGKTLDQIGNDIVKSGKTARSELGSYLAGAEQEWIDFYDFFKNKKIYVSDMLKNDVGKSEYQDILKNNFGNITVDPLKGINLDKSWSELADKFPTLISQDTINQADQLVTVLETLKKVRDQIKPISIQDLSGDDLSSAQSKVFSQVSDAASQIGTNIAKNIQNAAKTADGQFPVDIKINQDKIVHDIKSAISKASSITYDPVKVTLDVNTKEIKDSISQKLNSIDAGQLPQVSDGLEKIKNALQSMAGLDLKSTGINSTINALRRLASTDLTNFDTAKISGISDALSKFANIPDISSSVNRLVSSLAKLSASGGSIGTVTSTLPVLGDAVSKFVANASNAGAVSGQLNTFIASLAKLATAGNKTGQTASQLDSLSQATLNFFTVMKNAPEISANTLRMTEALAQLANSGSKANAATNMVASGFSRLSSAGRGITGVGSKIASAVSGASNSLLSYGNTATDTAKKTSNLVSQLTSLYIKFFTLSRIIKSVWKSVSSASDYVETLNYFNSAFDQVTDGLDTSGWEDAGAKSAEEYVGSFEKRAKELTKKLTGFEVSDAGDLMRSQSGSLGLNPDDTMNYQATYAQMASSMGATADNATKLSQVLTEIGGDLASVKNLDFNDVWQDMASGMVGMSRALDKYGINIRVANLQQELYNLGIDTTVAKLNQSDKAILRTIVILNSSKYAWADLASTINQPANQVRMLKSNFEALARSIGTLLLPIVAKVLPYLNGITIAVERVFSGIARLLGIKLSDYVSSTKSASIDMDSMADASDNAASGLGNADKNAKKLKKSLSVLPFDELNQLNSDKDSSGSSSSGSGGATPHIPALDDALADAISNYQKVWDEAFGSMENKAQQVADKITNAFEKIRKAAKPTTNAIKKLWNEGLSKLGSFSINALKNLWKNYLKPMGNWVLSDNSGLPRFFKITNDILNKINWSKLQTVLKNFFEMLQKPTKFVWTGLMDFYENFLKPISVWTMNEAIPKLVDALTRFGNTIHWDELNAALSDFWSALAPFAQTAGEGIVSFFENLLKIGADFINDKVPNGLKSISEALRNIDPETAKQIGVGLVKVAVAIAGFKGLTFIGGIIGKDSPLAKGLALLSRHPYIAIALGLAGVVTALDNFGIIDVDWEWLSGEIGKVKDAISNFIDKVDWDAIGTSIGKFADAFAPFAAGFADSLISGLQGLLDLGADLLNAIGWAIGKLGDALSKIDPQVLKALGTALGNFVKIKLTWDFVSRIGGLVTKLSVFQKLLGGGTLASETEALGEAATAAGTGLSSLSSGLPTLALMAKIAIGIAEGSRALGGFIDTYRGGNGVISHFSATMDTLSDSLMNSQTITGTTKDEVFQLSEKLENGEISAQEFGEQLAGSLGNAGVKASELEGAYATLKTQTTLTKDETDALDTAIKLLTEKQDTAKESAKLSAEQYGAMHDKLQELGIELGLSTEQINTVTQALNTQQSAGSTAEDAYNGVKTAMQNMGFSAENSYKILETLFPSSLMTKIGDLQTTADKVSFAQMVTNSTNAINAMGGIWKNGKQILGDDAIAIHDAIQAGLQPDENGYYDLGNGQMVQYGKGIKEYEGNMKDTMSGVISDALGENGILPEGYKLMKDNAGYHIKGYTDELANSATKSKVKEAYKSAIAADQESLGISLKKDGADLAKNTVDGYNNYLKKDGANNTSLATEQWAKQGITDPAENKLEIHSPSKLFARYAEYVEKGYSDKIKSLATITAASMNTWILQGIQTPIINKLRIEKGSSGLASDYGTAFGKGLSSGILETKGENESAVGTVLSALKTKLNTYNTSFENIGEKYMRKLNSGINSEKNDLENNVKNITGNIKGAFSSIQDSMWSYGHNAIQNFANGIRSVPIKLPHLKMDYTDWQDGDSHRWRWNSSVDWYAKGGLFNGAQVIGVGEAGREAVLPLENRRTMNMIADSIVSSSDNTMGLTKEEMAQAVAQGVAMAMMNNSGNNPKYIMNSINVNGREIMKAVTEAENDANYRLNPSPAY